MSGLSESLPPTEDLHESPRHGFQGNRRNTGSALDIPRSLTIAISREAGARGTPVARAAGEILGWQVYPQEHLEYIAQEPMLRQDLLDSLPPQLAAWVEERFQQQPVHRLPQRHPTTLEVIRVILALGAQGEVILIGRGAGCILPAATTLNVRLIAPLADRVAYMSQWLRLTTEEAAEQVRLRDQRRSEFLASHFQRQAGDVHQYDLVLNTSSLGAELSGSLVAQAAQAKLKGLLAHRCDPPPVAPTGLE